MPFVVLLTVVALLWTGIGWLIGHPGLGLIVGLLIDAWLAWSATTPHV